MQLRPAKLLNYELSASALCARLLFHPFSLKCFCSSSLRETCHFGTSNVRKANDILMFGQSTANSLLAIKTWGQIASHITSLFSSFKMIIIPLNLGTLSHCKNRSPKIKDSILNMWKMFFFKRKLKTIGLKVFQVGLTGNRHLPFSIWYLMILCFFFASLRHIKFLQKRLRVI